MSERETSVGKHQCKLRQLGGRTGDYDGGDHDDHDTHHDDDDDHAEMEKRADGADASVLFFILCCANFLAV